MLNLAFLIKPLFIQYVSIWLMSVIDNTYSVKLAAVSTK